MKVLNANIDMLVLEYLKDILKQVICVQDANKLFLKEFGIVDFFLEENELVQLKEDVFIDTNYLSELDRSEYGDFQTNKQLSENVAKIIKKKGSCPKLIIEPTCGKGNFIIALLNNFEKVENIVGIEIYKPYIWEAKFQTIGFYLKHKREIKPKIHFFHESFFDFNFKEIARRYKGQEILIIGNPPWVTNSELGSLNSSNLPKKRNFKNHNGLDAITGKGNFDIAEYITLQLIDIFQEFSGFLSLLVKKSVIKNIIYNQKYKLLRIGNNQQYAIDAKKEFDVSVEAALFLCTLNKSPELDCDDLDFYNANKMQNSFGWVENNFVSNTLSYKKSALFDGVSPFEWRQGVKHDCSSIMELDKNRKGFSNKKGVTNIELENDLVYGILKSSDLKSEIVDEVRKYTIISQKKVGQETKYIQYHYPRTYNYLIKNIEEFNKRKSNIYKNKPLFSIFGIGDYSFKPYKVAISGLYKTYQFSLIIPKDGKPLMLDDTCYFLGFDKIDFAVFTLILLNSPLTIDFLKSITFLDAKRVFTKEVLMRIDLLTIASEIEETYIAKELMRLNLELSENINIDTWMDFLDEIQYIKNGQLELF